MKLLSKLALAGQSIGLHTTLRGQLIRSGVGTVFVHISSRLIALVFGVMLARVLGPEGYGDYAYAMAVLSLLTILAELGMPMLVLREVAVSDANQCFTAMRGIVIRSLQIVVIGSGSISLLSYFIIGQLELTDIRTVTLGLIVIILPFVVLIKVLSAMLRGLCHVVEGQLIESLIRPILALLAIGGLYIWLPSAISPKSVIEIQIVIAVIILCLSLVLLKKYLPTVIWQIKPQYQTRKWLSSALPFILLTGAGLINSQTDILMLGYFVDPTDIGLYRVATNGAGLVAFGLMAANVVIAPQFARMYAQGDMVKLQRLVTVSARIVLLCALPIFLTFTVAGDAVISWIFGLQYSNAYIPLAILSAGQLVDVAMGSVGYLLNMTGYEKDASRLMLLTAAINIVLNLFLIPLFGLAGAASSTAITTALWNLLLYRAVKKRIGIRSTAFILRT